MGSLFQFAGLDSGECQRPQKWAEDNLQPLVVLACDQDPMTRCLQSNQASVGDGQKVETKMMVSFFSVLFFMLVFL